MPKTTDLLNDRIEKYITGLIQEGKFTEGDRLPSEREIGLQFGASKIPVRQATQKLVDRGILTRVPGKGTFIRQVRTEQIKTNTIAVVHPYSESSFFSISYYSLILEGVEQEARQEGKSILFKSLDANHHPAPENELHDLRDKVDGYILISLFPGVFKRLEQTIKNMDKPVVLVNYEGAGDEMDSIVTDSRANMKRMVGLLAASGHTRIGYTYNQTAAPVNPRALNRLEGYRDGLKEAGLPVDDGLVAVSLQSDTLKAYLHDQKPTALVCGGDYIAINLYRWCRDLGIRIPDDLAVTGYGDTREIAGLDPELTTMQIPLPAMGQAAVRRLREKLVEEEPVHTRTVFPGKLMVRKSHIRRVS